jgi:hypothetical protein
MGRVRNHEWAAGKGDAVYFGYNMNGGSPQWNMGVLKNNATWVTATAVAATLTAGDKIKLRLYGDDTTGWRFNGGAWTKVISLTQQEVRGGGNVNLEIAGNDIVCKLSHLYGGAIRLPRYDFSLGAMAEMQARGY